MVFILVAFIFAMSIPKIGRRDVIPLQLYLGITLVVEIIGIINIHALHRNMNLLLSITDLVGFPLGVWFYQRRIPNFSKLAAGAITFAFVCLGLINLFFFQGLHAFNSYTSAIGCIGFVGLSITYSLVLLRQSIINISKLGMYWINAAILFYYMGIFWFVLLVDYLVRFLNSNLITLLMMHHCFGIMFYSTLGIGLIKLRREYLSRVFTV